MLVPNAALANPPLFVVAAPRSGTTLMRSLLSAHSRVAVTPETHFLKFAEQWDGEGDGAPTDPEAFWRALAGFQRFQDVGVTPARARALAGGETYRDIFAGILAAYAEREGKPRVGEKTPLHAEYLARLRRWFPDSPIVYMARDPRATIASHLTVPWVERMLGGGSKGIWGMRRYQVSRLAHYWTRLYGGLLHQWADDPRVLILRYEDLVADTPAAMRTVCGFVGEPFEEEMLDRRSGVAPPAATDRVEYRGQGDWRQWNHRDSLKPISADRTEKWRAELSDREVAVIEGVCGAVMERLGYTCEAGAAVRRAGAVEAQSLRAGLRVQNGLRATYRGLRGAMPGSAMQSARR